MWERASLARSPVQSQSGPIYRIYPRCQVVVVDLVHGAVQAGRAVAGAAAAGSGTGVVFEDFV